jgi:hypothetical protein
MDISIRKKVRHAASDLQVPRPLVPLEYTGCFVRSIVRRVLAMSTRSSACAGSADVARGQNGFATPLVGGGFRLDACSIRQGVGVHSYSGSM